jgi:hypothetical protein
VTPTPGCTANFPGNPCSQPLIFGFIPQIWSRATCRVSGQTISHQFFVVYSWKRPWKRLYKGAGIWESTRMIPIRSDDFTTTVPVQKLHESHIVRNPIFIYDWRSYRGGKVYAFWIVTTILQCCYRILHGNG